MFIFLPDKYTARQRHQQLLMHTGFPMETRPMEMTRTEKHGIFLAFPWLLILKKAYYMQYSNHTMTQDNNITNCLI
jgi:hypothetical protein